MGSGPTIIDLGIDHVRTTVAKSPSDIKDHIRDFLTNSDNKKKIIGLDMERSRSCHLYPEERSEFGIIQLCDGTKCLIIQLRFFNGSFPNSLFNFLQLPNFTFVGIGIKEYLLKLERRYGVGGKNAVDLRQFAAEVMLKPKLVCCGVDELALKVLSLKIDMLIEVVFDDWGASNLNEKQIKFAAANVYAYYKIANKLLSLKANNHDK